MPTTRKKLIKTVYKDDDSEEDGDFSDSGSDAKFSDEKESSSEDVECAISSGDEFNKKSNVKPRKSCGRKPKFTKTFIKKINKQMSASSEKENTDVAPALFTIKDLSDADKLLPSILNLSESDSSDDECLKDSNRSNITSVQPSEPDNDPGSDNGVNMEYKDVWSNNIKDDSEEIAKKTFMELEQHKSKIEATKASLQNYTLKINLEKESDVKDLLALGEELEPAVPETVKVKKKTKSRRLKDDSDSEMEDWEEVKESKAIPQQGIQLFVEFPDAGCRKSKKVDVEMMMKRKINRVKKEYQVYMHKVHVLCWLGHGNFVSRVLNDQELMAAVLSLVPSKECYPGERVDMKYIEQITTWYKDKLTLKQDQNEDKFKPKAPPLKVILLEQIKNRLVTTRKYLVFIFVTMLRALGLQCRVMFNFVALPLKPPSSELCSLATKPKDEKADSTGKSNSPSHNKLIKDEKGKQKAGTSSAKTKKQKLAQVDGNDDCCFYSEDENIMQIDGNDDTVTSGTRRTRSIKRAKENENNTENVEDEHVSPPKVSKKSTSRASPKPKVNINKRTQKGKITNGKEQGDSNITDAKSDTTVKETTKTLTRRQNNQKQETESCCDLSLKKDTSPNKNITYTRSRVQSKDKTSINTSNRDQLIVPKISVTHENEKDLSSKYFDDTNSTVKTSRLSRKRAQTSNPGVSQSTCKVDNKANVIKTKARTKSAPSTVVEKSKYFIDNKSNESTPKRSARLVKEEVKAEDSQRVSHRDFAKANRGKSDVTGDLVNIIKNRIKSAKSDSQKGIKGKVKKESDEDSDYLPVEDPIRRKSESDDDFKPTKISPKPGPSRCVDRRVLSSTSSEEPKKNKMDVWCEIFVEELEQWISVDIIKGKVHSTSDLYNNATHPVCYVIGWDNNNYLKDLTRKYVPHWNTVTRKLRAEPQWWDKAIQPWLGPKTARDKEENEYLDRMQLEAPLPKSITEYKNHPLYALNRHLLKFEAIYPSDAAVLGFVRNEPVYARECVYTCRSRDTWLKEAKVVKLGEKPYKIVKARPKWDKLSNKLITDKPLEVFGPWQVQDYEPPTAENGIVPRNAYGNVELFKECMLPKGTVHIKLPGLNRVAKKLNIDCASAMTGFDFNGGWSHPVYDGFVVCQEFEEIVTEAWVKDQEEQERREIEKTEARVYGNWKRLIKGLLIRERLKCKYGFEEPSTSQTSKKSKGPRLVVKRK